MKRYLLSCYLVPELEASIRLNLAFSLGVHTLEYPRNDALFFISICSFSSSGRSKNPMPASQTRSYSSWSMPAFLMYRNPTLSNASRSFSRKSAFVFSDLASDKSSTGISVNAILAVD